MTLMITLLNNKKWKFVLQKISPTARIEPTSPYHWSLTLYLLRQEPFCGGPFLFFDLLSPPFVLCKRTVRSDKKNSKCGWPENSKISPKTHVLQFSNVISHFDGLIELMKDMLFIFLDFSTFNQIKRHNCPRRKTQQTIFRGMFCYHKTHLEHALGIVGK